MTGRKPPLAGETGLRSTRPDATASALLPFRGRRRGRRLRSSLRTLLEEDLPDLAITPADCGSPLDLRHHFDAPAGALWMEIGFGAGEHLAWQAERHPEVSFVGCEPYLNGVASLLRAVAKTGLGNVRIIADDVRPLLGRLPDACLDRLFILFPDPWPKQRHRHRRLVQWESVAEFYRLLRPGAEIRLATDDPQYLHWILVRLTAHPGFAWQARRPRDWHSRPPDWPATRYERKAISAGRQPAFLRFCKRSATQGGAMDQRGLSNDGLGG